MKKLTLFTIIFGFLCVSLLVFSYWKGSRSTVMDTGEFRSKPIWTFETTESITSTSAYDDGKVYIRTDKSVVALEAKTGKQLWQAESLGDVPLSRSPVVFGQYLIVPEKESQIAAFSTNTGQLIWRTPPLNMAVLYSPWIESITVANNLVFVARFDWSLSAYKIANGEVAWEKELSGRSFQYLISNESAVYLGTGSRLTAFDTMSGNLLWERDIGGTIGPMVQDGNVIYITDQANSSLLAFDLQNQKIIWRNTYDEIEKFEIGCLVESDEELYLSEHKLVAISKTRGRLDWISEHTGRLECPVILGNKIYVRNTDTSLFAFGITSGDEAGKLAVQTNTPMKHEPNRSPIAAGELLIVPVTEHQIAAYRP